jgi:hypothetical protein
MTASRVHVHIEHLVLDGIDAVDRFGQPADKHRLQAAISAAVAARLRDDPIDAPAWRHRAVHHATMPAVTPSSVERLADQVATAVHGGLAR